MALVAVLHREQLGAKIKERREALGLTQKGLADLVPVKEGQTVSRWERGISEPEDLGAVARALEYGSVSEFLAGIDMPEKNRRRKDPEGMTLLERLELSQRRTESKLDALLTHFKIEIPDLTQLVSDFERETEASGEPPVESKPQRRGRRAA